MNTERTLRVNVYQLHDAINKAVDGVIQRSEVFKSCLTCHHWEGENDKDTCKKYQARPPARIIANGCPDYDDYDDIPF